MAAVPTVAIEDENTTSGFRLINVDDFDLEKDVKYLSPQEKAAVVADVAAPVVKPKGK